MNIYDYIADSEPYASKAICNSFGYSLDGAETVGHVAQALEDLVRIEGEPAFRKILDLHPDRDLIVETYGSPQVSSTSGPGKCDCKKSSTKVADSYIQAATGTMQSSNQGQIFIMAAALILAVAIISKN